MYTAPIRLGSDNGANKNHNRSNAQKNRVKSVLNRRSSGLPGNETNADLFRGDPENHYISSGMIRLSTVKPMSITVVYVKRYLSGWTRCFAEETRRYPDSCQSNLRVWHSSIQRMPVK